MQIVQKILPTADMIRSARGYLNWSQAELGDRCGLSKVSLVGIESQRQHPNMQTLKRIATVFWEQGLTFLPEGGFSIDNQIIKVFEGLEGIKKFFEDVYITAREKGGEVLVSGADEEKLKKISDKAGIHDSYSKKIMDIYNRGKIKYKTLIGSTNVELSDYSEYRVLPEDKFASVPFYVYGEKVGIILWGKNIKTKIILIEDKDLANSYRKIFSIMWNVSELIHE